MFVTLRVKILVLFVNRMVSFRSMFVSKYVWLKRSRGHVTRLQRSCSPFAVHVLFSGKAVSGTWAPSTVFVFLFDSARVWPIRIYVRWSLFFITRSPLSGASIFHTYPLSQPCPVSFLFIEAPPTGFFAGVYIIANHKRATHAGRTNVFQ